MTMQAQSRHMYSTMAPAVQFEAILRAYFEFMYLFAPILDRIAFLRSCLLIAKLGFSFEVRLVNESLDWDRDTHIVPFWEQSAFEVQFKPRRGKGCPTIVFVLAVNGQSSKRKSYPIPRERNGAEQATLIQRCQVDQTTALPRLGWAASGTDQ
ncbi:Uncharacterized protein HZ326_25979 [Fusarium oxysporum f. sp. albedinis]|nr:Uncharacterized protein HZ326_25979 [Fusarium oxysporum f. sp. albedinis]